MMQNKSTFLIIVRKYPPQMSPEGICTAKFAKSLSDEGQQVTVLSDSNKGSYKENLDLFHGSEIPVHQVEPFNGTLLSRIIKSAYYSIKTRTPASDSRFVSRGIVVLNSPELINKFDFIYARGLPASSYYIAYLISKKANIPFAIHLSDPWPPSLIPLPYRNKNIFNFIRSIWARSILKSAKLITFPSHKLATYIVNKMNIPHLEDKILILPHILPDYEPDKCNNTKTDKGYMTIVHTGTVSRFRNPLHLLDALNKYRLIHGDTIRIKFVGHNWAPLEQIVSSKNLSSIVELHDTVSYNESLEILNDADVLLLLEAPTKDGVFLPSKFVDYLKFGKKIICLSPKDSEVSRYLKLIGEEAIPPDNTEEIFSTLTNTYCSWLNRTISCNLYSELFPYFSKQSVTRLFINRVNNILSNSPLSKINA